MRVAAKTLRLMLGVFVSLALAVGPAAALTIVKTAAPMTEMTGGESSPCDMPCDDCGGDVEGAACAVACVGLTVAVPAAASPAPSMPATALIDVPAKVTFTGRDREPDKPPPRLALA